jgi:hypothetical protein
LKEIQEEIMLVLLWDIDLMMNVNNGAGGDNTSRLIMGEEVITMMNVNNGGGGDNTSRDL